MKLLVGLGNPGAKYAANRHNVGFMAIERIADRHGIGPWRKKFQGLIAEGVIEGQKVLLLKPETFMNESGRAVGEAARFHKIELADIVVLYDEIDMVAGKLKAKLGGGNSGHNGLRSISAHLGNDYVRIRIGVGHPGHKDRVAAYVLSDFAKSETVWLEPMLDAIAERAGRLVKGDLERFLTDVALTLQKDGGSSSIASDASDTDETSSKRERAAAGAKHPSGERASKRQSALADNLRKWMEGRRKGTGE